ncbi:hypothetical protein ZIOFF_023334 [Zingiber officinale]|uniref:Pentatricopeptide repeat-containing protein n=1 Tax=Zingiber officinale TaxID=94328 RepID=A0A8J5HB05_ZINOF|nr:hypothetical protein ZIOFF_023334 [Zingiber officinale]
MPRLLHRRLLFRPICSATSTASSNLSSPDPATICDLASRQDWSCLKTLISASAATPADVVASFLRLILECPSSSATALCFSRWSQSHYRVPLELHLHCRLILALAADKLYPQIRSEFHYLTISGTHSAISILHMLSVSAEPSRRRYDCLSILADMLLLALVNNSKFDSAIEVFYRTGDYGKATDVLNSIKSWGFSPSIVSYNTLIDGHCKNGGAGKLYKADSILKEMVASNIRPSVITFNILINGYCKDGNSSFAMRFLDEMKRQGLSPNVVTYSSLINGLCCEDKLGEALELLTEMQDYNLNPYVVIFNAIINGLCKKGNMEKAKGFLDVISENNLLPNVITYNTLIDGCCRAGKLAKAVKLLDEMLEMGVKPSHLTYNTLIEAFCKKGNLSAAYNMKIRMERSGKRANVPTYNIFINYFCGIGKMEKADELLNKILEKGLLPNRVTYGMIKDEMIDKGYVPNIDGHLCSSRSA